METRDELCVLKDEFGRTVDEGTKMGRLYLLNNGKIGTLDLETLEQHIEHQEMTNYAATPKLT